MLRVLFILALTLGPAHGGSVTGPITFGDGDNLRVGGSPSLRLKGIDAYEMDQTCRTEQGVDFKCGQWVATHVGRLFNGRTATCRWTEIDRYDRPLAFCEVAGQDLGAWLVAQGFAQTYGRDPTYETEEKAAILLEKGLWAFSGTDPKLHRAAKRRATRGVHAPDPNCTIKGNISANGQIYHLVGQRDYDKTGINETRGERWFCSEAEAQRAGWRRARR